RPGPARAVRLDADAAQADRGGEGGQDRRPADLPAGAVHLPRNLCSAGRPGGDKHHGNDNEEIARSGFGGRGKWRGGGGGGGRGWGGWGGGGGGGGAAPPPPPDHPPPRPPTQPPPPPPAHEPSK